MRVSVAFILIFKYKWEAENEGEKQLKTLNCSDDGV
jgi:hypothetical protein